MQESLQSVSEKKSTPRCLNSRTIRAAIMKTLRPPPKLTISQWADRYRRLSSESSAEPGYWRTARAEYQRGIMDAITDGTVKEAPVAPPVKKKQ